jgi:hypothetical protein
MFPSLRLPGGPAAKARFAGGRKARDSGERTDGRPAFNMGARALYSERSL